MKQLGFIAFLLNRYSQSLICYDCYDTGPSNENCLKSKNCTGEACLLYEGADLALTTAFCLLNLPKQYHRRRVKFGGSTAECWTESDGKGKHCICSQDFCNKLRDRRFPSDGGTKLPLANATMVERNPLIDYDDQSDVGAVFTVNLEHPGGNEAFNTAQDLVPVGIESYDYEDDLKVRIPAAKLPPPATAPPPLITQYPLPTRHYTTTGTRPASRRKTDFYATIKNTESKLPVADVSRVNVAFPDQLLQEIKQNRKLPKLASSDKPWNFACFIFVLLSNLLVNSYF